MEENRGKKHFLAFIRHGERADYTPDFVPPAGLPINPVDSVLTSKGIE